MSEFDGYAESYNQVLEQSVAMSGEEASYFADYKARFIAERVVSGPNAKILDFGCGIGNVSVALRKLLPLATLHGYDPSAVSIERASNENGNCAEFFADHQGLASDYDVILMAGVMHHIAPEQRSDNLKTTVDMLAPGGKLVIVEHNPFNPLIRKVVDACPYDKDAVLLAASETVSLLTSAGLNSLRRDYIVFFPRIFSFARFLERHLGWCPLGAQYVVIGRKKDEHIAS